MKLWKARKTAIQMLTDRGYILPSSEKADISFADFESSGVSVFAQLYGSRETDDASGQLGELKDDIVVWFSDKEKLAGDEVKEYWSKMTAQNLTNAVLVYRDQITSQAKQEIEFNSHLMRIELFHIDELQVNITEHQYVPTHIPMKKEQKKRLLKKYRLKDFQLPKILKRDPVARYLGLVPGDVVKIIRPSETAGKYVTYRICD